MNQPWLQEVGSSKPQYFNTNSIMSNVASITTPYTDPVSDLEPTERFAEGESFHPFAFNTTGCNSARSRSSYASGLLSIITLPSFITNDRPLPYSSPVGVRVECPVRLNNHHRKQSSLIGRRFSGTDSVLPVSSVNDDDMSSKWSLQIITSALEWSSSISSPVGLHSPSRSPRSSQGRLNLSLDAEDEAAMRWRELPSLPSTQGVSSIQTPHSRRATGVGNFSTEWLPSYCEKELKPPGFFAARVPLPHSPSTPPPSVSPLRYALPSPDGIPPTNGFTTPYASYPLLPSSISPSPGPFSYPPTPRSSDKFMDVHTIHRADQTLSLTINTPHRLSDVVCRTHSKLYTPTTPTLFALPGNNSGFLPYAPDDDRTRGSIYRRSGVSAYSQSSTIQDILLPPPPSLAASSSPSTPVSRRGPRPLPIPGQAGRSRTPYSQKGSTAQHLTRE